MRRQIALCSRVSRSQTGIQKVGKAVSIRKPGVGDPAPQQLSRVIGQNFSQESEPNHTFELQLAGYI